MTVLYFHQHFNTPDGSGGTRSYEFARALVARGHRVTMVCGRNDRAPLDLPWEKQYRWSRGFIEGIDVIALPLSYSNRAGLLRRAFLFLRFAWRSTALALRKDYDVLFATSTPLTAGIPGIVMRLLGRRKPFVFEVRDLWPELPRALGMRNPILLGGMSALEWLSYRCATVCIGLAPGIVEGIRRRSPRDRHVELIPNGCDLDLFHPAKRAPLELPGVKRGDFVAGFTGAHGIANGLDALLDAGAELARRGRTNVKLVLVGDGNQKDRLVARARAEGLTNVLFFPPVKKTDIARITASFDCGLMILANVSAFYYGTSPNKFFDYISSGLPVVNNYPGWLGNLISGHACGVVVHPDNPAALADALIKLADDPNLREVMGRNARLLAESEFDRAALSAQFVSVIESVAASHPHST
jgi:glycosyltransferase involved in cell wall biosynthesis